MVSAERRMPKARDQGYVERIKKTQNDMKMLWDFVFGPDNHLTSGIDMEAAAEIAPKKEERRPGGDPDA